MNTTVIGGLHDPKLDTVSFTEVVLSPDMQFLKVFFSCFDEESIDREEVKRTLNRSAGFVKSVIADAHIMRTIPDIHFYYDDTTDRISNLDKIFEHIHREHQESDDE